MANIKNQLETLFTEIGNSIRLKDGSTEKISPSDFPERIQNLASGGGLEINGNVVTYECLEPITAGDFVETINNVNKELAGRNVAYAGVISSILLEPNKVFTAYISSGSYYLQASIIEINGTNMTITTTQLNSTARSCYTSPNCILLEPNKVFIAHAYSNSKHLYCTIVNINGTEMTATTTALYEVEYATYTENKTIPNCILLEPNKVFVGFTSSSDHYLYGAIVNIDTTITATITQLNATRYSCFMNHPAGVLLEPNKILLVHDYTTRHYIGATIIEINGNDMTATTTEIGYNNECPCTPVVIKLSNNKVFIAYSSGSYYSMWSRILEVDGTTVSSNYYGKLGDNYSSYTNPFGVLLDDGTIFIVHSNTSDKHLYATKVIAHKDDTIEKVSTIPLNTTVNSNMYGATCVPLEEGKVFIPNVYTSSLYFYGTIYLGGYRAIPASTNINGVAKTSGAAEETIEVYVPKEAN